MTPAQSTESKSAFLLKNIDGAESCLLILTGRWKLRILASLFDDQVRFSVLQRRVKGISKRILNHQLKELERKEIVRRTRVQGHKNHVLVELTPAGQSLADVITVLNTWGARQKNKNNVL